MQTIIDPVKAAELYRKEFDASPEIREEFGNNFEPYAAYRKAEDAGLVKSDHPTHLTTLQLLEKFTLEYQLTPSLRERYSTFDSYRKHRWGQETGHR